MRLTDRVESRIVQAIHVMFTEKQIAPPDHEFFIINTPSDGLRAMVALIVPVSDEDNTAQFDDIDPYATQAEFDELVGCLYQAAQQARSGIVLAAAPGLAKRASGLVVPS